MAALTREAPKRKAATISAAADAERPAEHEPERAPDHVPERAEERPERVRTRTRTSLTVGPPTHDTYINFQNIPKDISLNWKLFTANGKEFPFYLQAMRKQGWEPVNPQEHPDWLMLPPGYKEDVVIVDGLILMERPMSLTKEAEADNKAVANQRMREARQRLGMTPDNTMTREHDEVKPRVSEEWNRPLPMPIEE